MKTNLQILAFEHKVTKVGKPFCRFQTEQGWMNSFDSVINEKLMQKLPASFCVEIEEKPNALNPAQPFRNITMIYDDVVVEKPGVKMVNGSEIKNIPSAEPLRAFSNNKPNAYPKDPVGLAVEILGHTMKHATEQKDNVSATKLMTEATDLVKQAIKKFAEREY